MNIEQLKIIKKNKRMTLQEISDISGIPKRTVDQIFSGKTTNPRIDTIQAIERALGINSDNLPEEIETGFTAQEHELITLFRGLSPNLKDFLLQTASTLSGQPYKTDLHKKA